jgi:pimeloyl-ACP methyl ester carboxylesterase
VAIVAPFDGAGRYRRLARPGCYNSGMPIARHAEVEIYHETFGAPSASPLVLINGLGSQCINYSEAWCEKFVAAGFFVVRMDNRDVGLSSHLPDAEYTLSDMAGDVIAVLDHLGVARAHVCGLSMGGMIVQTLAIEHPDRLLTATSVMSTTGEPDYGQASPEAFALLFGAPATDEESFVQRQLDGARCWGAPACFDPEAIRASAVAAYRRSFDPAGRGRQAAAVGRSGSRADALRHVRVPMLVLHGDRDTLIDPSGGRRTAELVPGARFVLLEGMGHDYPPEYWDRWVALVAEHAGLAAS